VSVAYYGTYRTENLATICPCLKFSVLYIYWLLKFSNAALANIHIAHYPLRWDDEHGR
jgi:hypothetical protein